MVAELSTDLFLTLVFRFPRVLLASLFKRRWSCSTKLDYDPYETITDLVMDLGLLLLGSLYCPLLPIFLLAKLTFGYSLRLFHIWVNCSASRHTHSPSCIRALFVGFSAVMVLFANVVYVYALIFNPVSGEGCGPFHNVKVLAEAITQKWYTQLPPNFSWSPEHGLSPAAIAAYILAALIAVLLFGLYISHLKRLSIERDANELKCQLAIATQEKCYLISKIKKPIKPNVGSATATQCPPRH